MGTRLKVLVIVAAIMFATFVIRSIRASSMRPTFAWLWIAIVSFLLSVPVLEGFYKWLAVSVLEVLDARPMIYMPLIGFLLIYVFHMTTVLSRISDRVQELITHTAVLESELRALQRQSEQSDKATGKGL